MKAKLRGYKAIRGDKIKVEPFDLFNVDVTIAKLAVPLLEGLKNLKAGSPFVDDVDVPKEIKSTSAPPLEKHWHLDDFHDARWRYVQDEMIFAMRQIAYNEPDFDFPSFSYSSDEYKDFSNRVTNGCRLFGKYFQALWS